MKNYHAIPVLIIILGLLISAPSVQAQSLSQDDDFFSKTTFRLSTNFFSQNSGSAASSHLSEKQNQLFYSNPFFGVEMDYAVAKNISVNLGISYSGAKSNYQYDIEFVIPPDPDFLSSFKTRYRFSNISLEPKAKMVFDIQRVSFFWSAGPIISAASLSSDFDAAPFKDHRNYSPHKESGSRSIGFGGQASTGIQYFFIKNIGVSAEIGYKYLQHNSLQTEDEMSTDVQPYQYELNTLFNRFGLVFKF